MKANRLCSWTGARTVILTENLYASGRHKRPRGPRSDTGFARKLGGISRPPSTDLTTAATFYYVNNHLRVPGEALSVTKGMVDDFLPIWTSVSGRPGLLQLAVASVALAVFSRTQKYPPAAMEASTRYHQLLRVARSTIASMKQGDISAYLIAIYFMGRYENAVHQPDKHVHPKLSCIPALPSFSHHDGAMAVLKLWNDRLSHTQPPTDLIKYTRRWMIKSALLRNRAIPAWLMEGTFFGEHGWELVYDRILVQSVNLRCRISNLLEEITSQKRAAPVLLSEARTQVQEAEKLDNGLQDWIATSPIVGCYSQQAVEDWQAREFFSPTVYTFASLGHAAVWIQYYSMKIFINSLRFKIVNSISSTPDAYQRSRCLALMRSTADDMASSLPFCLQKVQNSRQTANSRQNIMRATERDTIKPSMAELTVWPLTIVSGIQELEEKQQLWFRSQLSSVGGMIGDRVIELDKAERWLEL